MIGAKSNESNNNVQSEKKKSIVNLSKGEVFESDVIRFEEIPIVSPNGEVLVEKISFEIKPGMNCIITGPNGCGKSSLFRILSSLWPIFGGKLYRPPLEKMFYIPQRPYLPPGTLGDQITYPHSLNDISPKDIKYEVIISLIDNINQLNLQ